MKAQSLESGCKIYSKIRKYTELKNNLDKTKDPIQVLNIFMDMANKNRDLEDSEISDFKDQVMKIVDDKIAEASKELEQL